MDYFGKPVLSSTVQTMVHKPNLVDFTRMDPEETSAESPKRKNKPQICEGLMLDQNFKGSDDRIFQQRFSSSIFH